MSKRANFGQTLIPPLGKSNPPPPPLTCLPTVNLGVCLQFTSLVCPGWLLRHLLSCRIHLPLSSLWHSASFSCPLAAQPPPLIISRCRRLSRHCRLLSAGASSWLSWRLLPCRCRFLSSRHSTTSCLQTPPLPLASCLPAGCCITPVVTPPLPLVLSTPRLRLSSSQHAASATRRAASASRHTAASCLLVPLLSFASLSPAGSHISESLPRGLSAAGKCTTPSAAAADGMGTIPSVGIVQKNALLQYSSKCSKRNLFTQFPGTTVQGMYLISNTVTGVGYSTILYEVGTRLKIPMRRGVMGLKCNSTAVNGGRVWTCRIRLGDVFE